MAILFILLAIFLYYFTDIDQLVLSEISAELIELETVVGFPLWMLSLAIGLVFQSRRFLQRGKNTNPSKYTRSYPHPERNQPAAKSTTNATIGIDWKDQLIEQAHQLKLPTGASIESDPFKDIPIGLKLDRTTPQATRRALETFAQFLSEIPLPPRVFIKLRDEIKTEVPPKNLVRGAFQKHLNVSELSITSQMDGIDIRFHNPDDRWSGASHLGADLD